MRSCPTSLPGSAPCRLEWRPSRWLLAALLLLTVLAPLAVLGSELPRPLAWPLALAAAARGLQLARREAGRAPRQLVLGPAPRQPGAPCLDSLDGQPLEDCQVRWRGPLAFLDALDREGRRVRLAWWPDTLPAARRRELRLAMAARVVSSSTRPMAP
nr:hypothetical protein [Pseudoxanthomonas suwonensis]